MLQSPTRDHDAVREALQSVKAAGSTATGDAIKAALQRLPGKAPAAIVLLSDGKSVRGSDPVEAAQAAKARKIPIYTVALGTAQGTINGGEPVPPDPQTLARDRAGDRRARIHGAATSRRSTRSTSASAPRSRPRSTSARSRTCSRAARWR